MQNVTASEMVKYYQDQFKKATATFVDLRMLADPEDTLKTRLLMQKSACLFLLWSSLVKARGGVK